MLYFSLDTSFRKVYEYIPQDFSGWTDGGMTLLKVLLRDSLGEGHPNYRWGATAKTIRSETWPSAKLPQR
jgi:hypothetical protein